MAQKKKAKQKKKNWLTTVLIYIFVPLTIWFLAFVTWLYWDSITALFSKDNAAERPSPRTTRTKEKNQTTPAKRPQEKILDDDRKKLEDILKQRQ